MSWIRWWLRWLRVGRTFRSMIPGDVHLLIGPDAAPGAIDEHLIEHRDKMAKLREGVRNHRTFKPTPLDPCGGEQGRTAPR